MADQDPLSTVSKIEQHLKGVNKQLDATILKLNKINGLAGQSYGNLKSVISTGIGSGQGLGLGTSNASFSNTAGGIGGGNAMPWMYSKKGAAIVGGVQMALGVASGAYAALPDTGLVMGRAMGYYDVSRRGFGTTRAGVAKATFSALQGGITGMGDDVLAANMLTFGYNYTPGGASFNQALREVRGAALGYNLSNPVAAQAIGAMHTGSMSGNLYQYGISTIDVKTGKTRSFGDIARQLYQKQVGSRAFTPEQLEFSMREGFIGADFNALGFSTEQQRLLRAAYTNFAQGKSFDLATETGADNPMKSAYDIYTSQTALAEKATTGTIAGVGVAADLVTAANNALAQLPDSVFAAKAALDTFAGTSVGQGTGQLIKGVGLGVATIAGAAALRKGIQSLGTKAATTATTTAAARLGLGTVARLGLRAIPYVGTAYLGYELLKGMFGTPANATQVSQTKTQMSSSMDPKLLQTLTNAGFRGESLNTAYGIVKAESGGRANAYNPTGMDDSYGLFQINMENNDPRNPGMGNRRNEMYLKKYASIGYTGPESLKDPYINARIAYDISKGGTNFDPWTTYTSGKYLQHTGESASANIGNKTVNISVNLSNASVTEANNLAKKVKEILLNDKDIKAMASK